MGTADRENETKHRVLRHYANRMAATDPERFAGIIEPHYTAEPPEVRRDVKADLDRIRHAMEGWGS